MGCLGRGFKSHHPLQKTFSNFPHVELEKCPPRYTQEMKPLVYWQVRPYIRPAWYPAVSGGKRGNKA